MEAWNPMFEMDKDFDACSTEASVGPECLRRVEEVRGLCVPRDEFAQQLCGTVARVLQAREQAGCPAGVLAHELCVAGFSASVRRNSGGGANFMQNLCHEFVVVAPPARGPCCAGAGALIVDAHFADHFAIPQPSAAYSLLLAALPRVWVGGASRLQKVVRLVAEAMAASFASTARFCPPWRRTNSLLSKWFTPEPSRGALRSAPAPLPAAVSHMGWARSSVSERALVPG